MENAFLTAASEAELSLSRMKAALDSLRTSLEQQDELTERLRTLEEVWDRYDVYDSKPHNP